MCFPGLVFLPGPEKQKHVWMIVDGTPQSQARVKDLKRSYGVEQPLLVLVGAGFRGGSSTNYMKSGRVGTHFCVKM